MNRLLRGSNISRSLLLAAVLGLAPGCTLFDDYLGGSPFTPDQPLAEVVLDGVIHVDPVAESTETCSAGQSMLWGNVRNTGDLDVEDVFITIEVFDASGRFLGSWRTHVFNGEVEEGTGAEPVTSASTSLTVDQSGTFDLCTPLSSGQVARTTARTEFTVVEEFAE